jgi:hypothetical protein
MDERSIDICNRSAPDRAGVFQKDPLFETEVFNSLCYHSTCARRDRYALV